MKFELLSKHSTSTSSTLPNKPTTIVCDGNSLTYGYPYDTLVDSYPAKLKNVLPSNFTIYNFGVNGQTTLSMIGDASSQIDSLYDANKNNILFAFEIGNDIYLNGNLVNAVNSFKQYCNDRRLVGWKVVALTLPERIHGYTTPFGDNDTVYTQKIDGANALLTTNPNSYCDYLLDLRADINFTNSLSYYYVADRVHYSAQGYAAIANKAKQALLSLI